MEPAGRAPHAPHARSAQPAGQVEVEIALGDVRLLGILGRPASPGGLVVFVHGSGSGRLSTRNQFVASALQPSG